MSAALIVFPITRRPKLIERTAAQMLARPPDLAEKHLAVQIRRQASAMRRRQLGEDAIGAEMKAFESAIRAALWRLVLTPTRPSGAA